MPSGVGITAVPAPHEIHYRRVSPAIADRSPLSATRLGACLPVSIAFLLFCVLFAASHIIHTRAVRLLTVEERNAVRLAWARQGVWPLLTMLCLIGAGVLFSWLLGHNEIFMPAFAVAAMGVAIGYAIIYLRELDSLNLPDAYLKAARLSVGLTYGGALLLLSTLLADALSSPWREASL